MKLFIQRLYHKAHYTIGRLFVNGQYSGDTLEPPTMKVGGCIPEGTYRIRMENSRKFRTMLPLIVDVPYRSGIFIHQGNTADDTKGCVLVGHNTSPGKVMLSQRTLAPVIRGIMRAEMAGEPVVITIR